MNARNVERFRVRIFSYSNTGSSSIELSESNFESLFVGADNKKAVENFNLRTEDLLTDLFTPEEDSGQGITTVTDEEIQARNEARIPQSTRRATSWSTLILIIMQAG